MNAGMTIRSYFPFIRALSLFVYKLETFSSLNNVIKYLTLYADRFFCAFLCCFLDIYIIYSFVINDGSIC